MNRAVCTTLFLELIQLMQSLFRLLLLTAALLIGQLGCTGGKDKSTEHQVPVFPVSGVVTLNGAPLAEATVTFRSTANAPAASSVTNAQGEFHLSTYKENDGAAAGDYKITVSKFETVIPPPGYNSDTSPPLPEPKSLVPVQYLDFDKSGLAGSVTAASPNRFNLELSSK